LSEPKNKHPLLDVDEDLKEALKRQGPPEFIDFLFEKLRRMSD
jgi:hypothetical protein